MSELDAIEAQPVDDPALVLEEPTDAHPPLLGAECGGGGGVGFTDETVAQPDFLNPEGFESTPSAGRVPTRGVTAIGLAILTPAAFAALRSSFSSRFLSFSFLSSASLSEAFKPFAFAAMSFILAL